MLRREFVGGVSICCGTPPVPGYITLNIGPIHRCLWRLYIELFKFLAHRSRIQHYGKFKDKTNTYTHYFAKYNRVRV